MEMQRCLLICKEMRAVAMQHKRCCNESACIMEVSTFWGVVARFEKCAHSNQIAIDKHCRDAIVCMIGMRKFKRCAMMAPIAKDVVLMVARMMWNDCVDGAWVVVQNK